MSPRLHSHNTVYIRNPDSVRSRERCLSLTIPPSLEDVRNVGFIQLRHSVLFSERNVNAFPAFRDAIRIVVCPSPRKQMAWVYALRVIAFVTNTWLVFRNWSICKFVRYSMGELLTKSRVSIRHKVALPRPAFIISTNVNEGEKPSFLRIPHQRLHSPSFIQSAVPHYTHGVT